MKVFVITRLGLSDPAENEVAEVTSNKERADAIKEWVYWNGIPYCRVEEFELDGSEAMKSAKS